MPRDYVLDATFLQPDHQDVGIDTMFNAHHVPTLIICTPVYTLVGAPQVHAPLIAFAHGANVSTVRYNCLWDNYTSAELLEHFFPASDFLSPIGELPPLSMHLAFMVVWTRTDE